ncbi:MAG: type transport system ATP-binding protein [Solirubrobacteraceae bacterium]|nr:type transport system ATP-binding protein [Solirubrobacteraceae bacterium]
MAPHAAQNVVVGVSGAQKTFRVPREATHTIKERVLHPLRRRGYEEFTALRDVSFGVRRGEFFGVVGRNGSGKSTLLKCLAGIYGLDRGRIVVDGRMSTFIELGVGFNPDLAARDNVIMNGIMLGLTPREAQSRYDEIIDFAELRDYQELKLKNYSSGMYVRLAFSVAIQVEADILLIDEVLAVGDASFQQKCFDVFNDMRDAGRTVLFVTHDMGSVARMCDRALLLERGNVVMIDEPDAVANRYLELNFAREQVAGEAVPAAVARADSAPVRAARGWIENDAGERVATCIQGQRYTFVTTVELLADLHDPAFTVLFLDDHHQDMLVATTAYDRSGEGFYRAGERVDVAVTLDPLFRPGRFTCTLIVGHAGVGRTELTRCEEVLSFVISGPYATGGLTDLPHEVTLRRAEQPVEQAAPPA